MGELMKAVLIEKEEIMEDTVRIDFEDAVEHGILVSNLGYHLARELGLDEEFCYNMAVAGMLHDIGKLKLSKYIYGRRKNTLVIEEMKYIRMHATFSYSVLLDKGYSTDILHAVFHHHENYDGTGYPDNMKGQEIPLGARILRVCDVFAALVSDRPYRKAFDINIAVELMIDEVKNFDMSIFLAFQRMIHEFDFLTISQLIEKNNRGNLFE